MVSQFQVMSGSVLSEPASRRLSRRALLAASALSAAVAMVVVPAAASAANECGPAVGGVATCTATGNPYAGGISYNPVADLTVVLQPPVLSTGAVTLIGSGPGAAAALEVDNQGTVSRTGGNTWGIGLFSGTGTVTVNSTGHVFASDNSIGIDAHSAGAVSVSAADVQTVNTGVYAHSTASTAVVNLTNASTHATSADGANVNGLNGATVTVGTITTFGNYATGVSAYSFNGPVQVSGGTVATTGFASTGVAADSAHGSVAVSLSGVTTLGDHSTGVQASSQYNDVSVALSGPVVTSGRDSYGVDAYALSTGGSVRVTAYQTGVHTTGFGATGIKARAVNDGATVFVSALQVSTAGDNAEGIQARTYNGSLYVDATQVSTSGKYATGIDASSTGGSVKVVGSAVSTGGLRADGIKANSNYGPVSVYSSQVVTSGDYSTGIQASGAQVRVYAGSVSTSGYEALGIDASSPGSVLVSMSSVATSGDNAIGVRAQAGSSAQVNGGSVSTSGYGATGVFVRAGSGVAGASVYSVTTSGDFARGVDISSKYRDANVSFSGTIHTSGYGATGILARTGSSGGSIHINGTNKYSAIVTTGDSARGVDAQVTNEYSSVNVNLTSVTTNGADSTGVFARTDSGDISITTGSVTTYQSNSAGIDAATDDGGYVLVSGGVINTSGQNSPGIRVNAPYGEADVSFTSVTTRGPNSPGVTASADYVTVHGGSVWTYGDRSDGINAYARYSNTVTFDSVLTTGKYSAGVQAVSGKSYESGDVVVTGTSVVTHGRDAHGIDAYSYAGNATVNVSSVYTSGDSSIGVYVWARGSTTKYMSTATANVGSVTTKGNSAIGILAKGDAVVVNQTGTVETFGSNAPGVRAEAWLGDANVTVNDVTTYNSNSTGVDVTADRGSAHVTVNGGVTTYGYQSTGVLVSTGENAGSVTVTGAPGSFIRTTNKYSRGIDARVTGDGSSVAIAVNAVSTSGYRAEGIFARTYNGPISITANSVTTSGKYSNGIDAYSEYGPVSVTAGSVTASGANSDAIHARSFYSSVSIAVSGHVSGYTDSIFADTNNGGPITVNIASTGVVDTNHGYAIETYGGPATINNAGVINGRINLQGTGYAMTGAVIHSQTVEQPPYNVVNNSGTFNATSNSYFRPYTPPPVVTSTVRALDISESLTPGPDVFNNTGVVNILPGSSNPGNVTFVNLGTFNNDGLVNLSNGHVGDTFTLPGVFNGEANSVLALDVNLAGIGSQTTCGPTSVGDCLVLNGGVATGQTAVRLTNIPTGPSGWNTTGIVVVDAVNGATIDSGAFFIDPTSRGYEIRGGQGAVSSGFFFYRLIPNGDTQEVLVSAPDVNAFQPVQFGAAATDLWYLSTGTWFQRESDLRQGIADRNPGGNPGVWLRFVGGWASRNTSHSVTSNGDTFNFSTNYDTSSGAFIGGVDFLKLGNSNRGFIAGVQGGYAETAVTFPGSSTNAQLSGGVIGGYGTFFSGPLYVDAVINANLLTLSAYFPTVPNFVDGRSLHTSTGVTSVGGTVEGGWDFHMGQTMIEPFASITYGGTSFNNIPVPGGGFGFNNVDTVRGSLGVRVAGEFMFEGAKVRPALYARVWDEWDGTTNTALVNAGPTVFATDNFRGAFGDVGGQIAIFGKGGVSGFFDTGYKFQGNYNNVTLTLGLRAQF